MFERFTDRARRVVVLAEDEARSLRHNYIGTEHLLLGLIREGEGVGAKVLEGLGIDLARVRAQLQEIIGAGAVEVTDRPPFTPRSKKVLELALREALQLGHNYIGTEHILLGLLREEEGVAAKILVRLGAGMHLVRSKVVELLSGYVTAKPVGVAPTPPSRSTMSPGLEAALGVAHELAGEAPTGTHHLLAAFAQNTSLLASRILAAGGFALDSVDPPPEQWDPAGTQDETPDQATARATQVDIEGDEIVVRLTDADWARRLNEAMSSGRLSPMRIRLELARFWRTLEPPDD